VYTYIYIYILIWIYKYVCIFVLHNVVLIIGDFIKPTKRRESDVCPLIFTKKKRISAACGARGLRDFQLKPTKTRSICFCQLFETARKQMIIKNRFKKKMLPTEPTKT